MGNFALFFAPLRLCDGFLIFSQSLSTQENSGVEVKLAHCFARSRAGKCYYFIMIKWTPALSTGVTLLDEHHKSIFHWLAELEAAAADKRRLLGVYSVARLKHYAIAHFAAEEALMKAANYPKLDEHMAEHALFRVKLAELQTSTIVQDVSSDTVEFLKEWLTNHITKTDMAYVPCLKAFEIQQDKA